MLVTFEPVKNMKQKTSESNNEGTKLKQLMIPQPPPPLPRFRVQNTINQSVTNQEIARFWRQKRIEEEEHLLAAIKASSRMRARNFTEDDYKRFEESLKDESYNVKDKSAADTTRVDRCNEARGGIKDWWTKSRYAYLNQPAIESMDPPKRRISSYAPNCFYYKPIPFYPTSLGVF